MCVYDIWRQRCHGFHWFPVKSIDIFPPMSGTISNYLQLSPSITSTNINYDYTIKEYHHIPTIYHSYISSSLWIMTDLRQSTSTTWLNPTIRLRPGGTTHGIQECKRLQTGQGQRYVQNWWNTMMSMKKSRGEKTRNTLMFGCVCV